MTAKRETRNVLAAFFREEYHSLKAYVRSMISDTADSPVEDIVQDVALRLFSRSEDALPIENIGAFVYGSLRNRVIDQHRGRKNKPRESPLEEAGTENPDFPWPEPGTVEPQQVEQRVHQAVMGLREPYRDIILAMDFEGLNYREISERTGTPAGTLMARRHRALGQLSEHLKELKTL